MKAGVIMPKVWCCRRFQDAEIYKILPTRNNILEEFVLFRKACSYCNRSILEILRMDKNMNILKPVRLKTKNIHSFMKDMEILCKLKPHHKPKNKISRFILRYNEFGKIKNCSNNLSDLKIGKIETNPIKNLKTYKRYKENKS